MAISSDDPGGDLPEWVKANYRAIVESGQPAEHVAARVEHQDARLAAYVRSLTVAKRDAPARRSAPGRSKG